MPDDAADRPTKDATRPAASRLIVAAAILGLFAWLFADVLFASKLFVYRDAAHFYYPMFEQVEQEWAAGRVPLWNPWENCGIPLLANPTASVFYPGKLVFRLPIGFDRAYMAYILMHVLLAAAGAYLLARRWGADIEGAGLAALAYAFGGNVMFQYCNVVFLCGAAWLPVAVLLAGRMLEERSPLMAAALGSVLALMTMGGDPQMAYQAGLLAALYALILWRADRAAAPAKVPDKKAPEPPTAEGASKFGVYARHRLALLGQAAAWSALLSAVQVLPTLEFGSESVRGHSELPRSLYEIPAYIQRTSGQDPQAVVPRMDTRQPAGWYDTLLGNPPPPAAHYSLIYQFSVSPWRLVEFLWPNVTGRQFPTNHRWISVVPAENAIWVPSFYLGLLPLVLAAGSWRLWRGDARLRWLSWMVLLSVAASFGQFGIGWLVRVLTGAKPVGDEVGGLYWLMVIGLPGYGDFRFPGKLLVVSTLGISLLAAHGWGRLRAGERPSRLLVGLGAASAALLLLAVASQYLGQLVVGKGWWDWLLADVETDAYFGPVDLPGAWFDFCSGLLHTAVLAGLLWWLTARSQGSWRWGALLLLTALDLAVANRWMVAAAPAELWHQRPRLAEVIEQAERERGVSDPAASPPRIFRVSSWHPPSWADQISPARQEEGLVWDRATLYPKYNLRDRLCLVQTAGTLELYDYELFWQPSIREANGQENGTEMVQPRRAIDAWGARYLVVPKTSDDADHELSLIGLREEWLEPRWRDDRPQGSPGGPRLPLAVKDPHALDGLEDVEVYYNTGHFPRTWIVHQVAAMPPIPRHDRRRVQGIMQATLFPFEHWLDMSQMALVEDDAMLMFAEQITGRKDGQISYPAAAGESSRIVHEDPQRVELEAVLKSPGLVVLSDVHYPGWTLEVLNLDEASSGPRPLPILKTNRMMRGAFLAPGRFRLIYRYEPASFRWGATISGLAWAGLLVWMGLMAARAYSGRRGRSRRG